MRIGGARVVDATKPATVKITARDVALGNTKDPAACAAARACKRDLHAEQARVHIGRTYIKIENKWMRFQTPEALRSEIIAFDRGGTFAPGEYVLRPLPPTGRLGKQVGSKTSQTKPRPRNPKPRRKPHIVTGIRQHGANR